MSAKRIFLGIGAQKAGTTTLTNYLAAHPEIHVPAIKEMHFFDLFEEDAQLRKRLTDDIRRRYRRLEIQLKRDGDMTRIMAEIASITQRFEVGHDPERYRAMLCDAPHAASVCGEFTPAYAVMNRPRMARIAEVLDQPRIIFMLRNPVDRFLSQVSHLQTPLSREQQKVDDPLELLKRRGFAARSRFETTLALLDDIFPSEHVFVGFFEDMFGPDAVDFHTRLCVFLGIDPTLGPEIKAGDIVPARDGMSETRTTLIKEFSETYQFVGDRMGRLPHNWTADLKA